MIESKFNAIFSDFSSERVLTNEAYGFDIKLGKTDLIDGLVLYTDGMSKYVQPVKEDYQEFKNVELYFFLPDFWDLKTNRWPIEWLEKLAEHPQKNDTWYGPGDTVDISREGVLFTQPFPASHFMLASPIALKGYLDGESWEEEGVQFFGVIPISQLELDYKIRNSATVLTNRLIHKGYSEQVDLFRLEVCKKRILGLFDRFR